MILGKDNKIKNPTKKVAYLTIGKTKMEIIDKYLFEGLERTNLICIYFKRENFIRNSNHSKFESHLGTWNYVRTSCVHFTMIRVVARE